MPAVARTCKPGAMLGRGAGERGNAHGTRSPRRTDLAGVEVQASRRPAYPRCIPRRACSPSASAQTIDHKAVTLAGSVRSVDYPRSDRLRFKESHRPPRARSSWATRCCSAPFHGRHGSRCHPERRAPWTSTILPNVASSIAKAAADPAGCSILFRARRGGAFPAMSDLPNLKRTDKLMSDEATATC